MFMLYVVVLDLDTYMHQLIVIAQDMPTHIHAHIHTRRERANTVGAAGMAYISTTVSQGVCTGRAPLGTKLALTATRADP